MLSFTDSQVDSFQYEDRMTALMGLAAQRTGPAGEPSRNVNMHMHSFFSYNALGYSPCHLAWAAREAGLYAAGLCDFDVLDGLDEFLVAGRILGLRVAVYVETRAFLSEYAEKEISSPGEPGVTYIMGAGFFARPAAGAFEAEQAESLRAGARARNVALVARINERLPEIAVEYERDVLPLTPGGNATERHIVRAYVTRARDAYGEGDELGDAWASILDCTRPEATALLGDEGALEERVRAKLVKRGGIGYVAPGPGSFPSVDEFLAWVLARGAIPMAAWLDGTSEGERDGRAMLECLKGKGVRALNIIPDRNWNIADADVRAEKVRNLADIVAVATELGLPVNVGTEANKAGQPFVDDLTCEVLSPFADTFIRGARIMVGHTVLAYFAGLSYTSKRAEAEFGGDTVARNDFFAGVGALPPLSMLDADALVEAGQERAADHFRDAVRAAARSGRPAG